MIFLCIVVNVQCKVCGEEELLVGDFFKVVCVKVKILKIDVDMLKCFVNVGFLGGEKKCNEILQMVMLEFKMCIFDEIDLGLDVDVMKLVFEGVNVLCDEGCLFFVIIYYQCLLDYIKLDVVYIMVDGCIVKIGGFELVFEVENNGYVDILVEVL